MSIDFKALFPAIGEAAADDDEHRRTCTEVPCKLCRRYAPRPPSESDAAHREARIARVLEWVPPAYAAAELSAPWLADLVTAANIDRAAKSIGAPRVAFIGPPGAGKTSLAAAMYRAAVRSEPSVARIGAFRWMSAHQLAKARAGHPLGEGEAPLVEAAVAAPLLVLDELGGEDPRHASAVAEVLYDRHAEQRATWVTTGVGSKEIASRYGGGIARRVFEGAVVFRLGAK